LNDHNSLFRNGRTNLEIEKIIDQLNRAFWKEAWHGPAVMEILNAVSAQQASARPTPNAHTIWEIMLHIASWKNIVARRLQGEIVNETPAEDWPAVHDNNAEAWKQSVANLQQAHQNLIQTLSRMTDGQLEGKMPGQDVSFYITIHGLIQHDLYHAGQISLLTKF
jgi:uncharacterized damage-inducible protein DinB